MALRGWGLEPTIAAKASSGCTGFIRAGFGLRGVVVGFLEVAMRPLYRVPQRLANQNCRGPAYPSERSCASEAQIGSKSPSSSAIRPMDGFSRKARSMNRLAEGTSPSWQS